MLVAVGVTYASGANFNASSANPSNQFSAGTLSMSNSKGNAAILTASGLYPGGPSQSGTVDIANTGSVPGVFSLTRGAITDTGSTNPISPKLNVTVKDCGDFSAGTPTCDPTDPTPYTGTLAGMTSASSLGTFAAAEKHRYQFTVALDSSADDNYQGGTSTVDFTWNAVTP
jgi:hypothetical protein